MTMTLKQIYSSMQTIIYSTEIHEIGKIKQMSWRSHENKRNFVDSMRPPEKNSIHNTIDKE